MCRKKSKHSNRGSVTDLGVALMMRRIVKIVEGVFWKSWRMRVLQGDEKKERVCGKEEKDVYFLRLGFVLTQKERARERESKK
jgi:hypothetical protein